jgi:hypothetical protein
MAVAVEPDLGGDDGQRRGLTLRTGHAKHLWRKMHQGNAKTTGRCENLKTGWKINCNPVRDNFSMVIVLKVGIEPQI